MAEEQKLNKPWLVAVWPGMGQVAISAGYYLMAKLGMHLLAELPGQELRGDAIEISGSTGDWLARRSGSSPGATPRGRTTSLSSSVKHSLPWESTPSAAGSSSPRGARGERVFTFAAMATPMHPDQDARVFGAATDLESLAELKRLDLESWKTAISAASMECSRSGCGIRVARGPVCLARCWHSTQFPYPKASLAILEVFAKIAGIEIDLTELSEQVRDMEQKLGELLVQMKQAFEQQQCLPRKSGCTRNRPRKNSTTGRGCPEHRAAFRVRRRRPLGRLRA